MEDCLKIINNVNYTIINYEECNLEDVIKFLINKVFKTRCDMMTINYIRKEIIMNGTECNISIGRGEGGISGERDYNIVDFLILGLLLCIIAWLIFSTVRIHLKMKRERELNELIVTGKQIGRAHV